MINLIDGAVGIEIMLEQGVAAYKLPYNKLLEGKKILSVSFCHSDDVPFTPSGNPTLAVGAEKLLLRLADINSELTKDYSISDIDWKADQLSFYQTLDFEKSELILTNLENPEYFHGRSVYLIFWYGENCDKEIPQSTQILSFELTISSQRTLFGDYKSLNDKRIAQLILSFPGFTPTGKVGIDRSQISDKFISFAGKDSMLFWKIPLRFFHLSYVKQVFYLNNLSIDFENSFLECSSETSGESLFFNIVVL